MLRRWEGDGNSVRERFAVFASNVSEGREGIFRGIVECRRCPTVMKGTARLDFYTIVNNL